MHGKQNSVLSIAQLQFFVMFSCATSCATDGIAWQALAQHPSANTCLHKETNPKTPFKRSKYIGNNKTEKHKQTETVPSQPNYENLTT